MSAHMYNRDTGGHCRLGLYTSSLPCCDLITVVTVATYGIINNSRDVNAKRSIYSVVQAARRRNVPLSLDAVRGFDAAVSALFYRTSA